MVPAPCCFYLGAAFCYFFVFGQAFPAIQRMAPMSVPSARTSTPTVITMFIAFGVAFGAAVAVVILAHGFGHRRTVARLAGLFLSGLPLWPVSSRRQTRFPWWRAGSHGAVVRSRYLGGLNLHPPHPGARRLAIGVLGRPLSGWTCDASWVERLEPLPVPSADPVVPGRIVQRCQASMRRPGRAIG